MDFRKIYGKLYIFVPKLRESAGNRSQMVSGCIMDVCDALARVSALSDLPNSSKITQKTSLAT